MVAINFASSRLRPPTFMSAVAISRLTMPLRAQGTPLRAIAAAMRAGGGPPHAGGEEKGLKISHAGVKGVLRAASADR